MKEDEVIAKFIEMLFITKEQAAELMLELVQHQKPIKDNIEIIKKLHKKGYNLYSVTDNTKEFVQYYRDHKDTYEFIDYFKDIANSAELGVLKPNPKMYDHTLQRHNLKSTKRNNLC